VGLSIQLPDFVNEKINQVQQRTNISKEDITKDYLAIYTSDFIQKDDQFKSDEERHRYASSVMTTRYLVKPPVQEYEVVVVGFSGVRVSKAGKPTASMFALVKKEGKMFFKRIAVMGGLVTKLNEITPFSVYTVKLGQFSSKDGQSGDFIADERAVFDSPLVMNRSPEEIMDMLRVKRLTIKDTKTFPSATTDAKGGAKGYLVETDWRVIRAIVVSAKSGTKDNGTVWGNYRLTDDTVTGETKVSPSGDIQPVGLTAWINPMLMVYDAESEVDVYGSIQIDKSGEPQMNCYAIIPVHARKLEVKSS